MYLYHWYQIYFFTYNKVNSIYIYIHICIMHLCVYIYIHIHKCMYSYSLLSIGQVMHICFHGAPVPIHFISNQTELLQLRNMPSTECSTAYPSRMNRRTWWKLALHREGTSVRNRPGTSCHLSKNTGDPWPSDLSY